VTSRARQREQAEALVRGYGLIVAEFFDAGQSRTVAWGHRPEAAALVVRLTDPGRGWDAVVVGEYERASYGSQYAAMAPLFEHYGVQLWMPEAGGRVDFASEHDERTMTHLGLCSKREVTRTSIRVRTAMAVQVREQGRYLGGRPPYGYQLGDAGAAPEQGACRMGPPCSLSGTRPGNCAYRPVNLCPAAGGPFDGTDRAGAERGGRTVPVGG